MNISYKRKICNYNCPVCKKSGNEPNLLGRFFLINETECKCNGCNTVFDKTLFYKNPFVNAINVKKHN